MDVYSLTVDMYIPSGQPDGIYSINYILRVFWDLDVLLGVYLEVKKTLKICMLSHCTAF